MNNKRAKIPILILLLLLCASFAPAATEFTHDYLVKDLITRPRLRLLPIPSDFRNYFVLQSIDNTTNVIIGDFVGAERLISLITDEGSDESINAVSEYFPDSAKFTSPEKPSTKFFTGMKEVKQQIINGSIFRNSYSNKMNSLDLLRQRLERGKDIFRRGYGYSVKIYDPDRPNTIMSEFYFSKNQGRYDLIFATYYYKIFNTTIAPSVYFSVYCRNSKDPVVAEVVDSLLKIVAQ